MMLPGPLFWVVCVGAGPNVVLASRRSIQDWTESFEVYLPRDDCVCYETFDGQISIRPPCPTNRPL